MTIKHSRDVKRWITGVIHLLHMREDIQWFCMRSFTSSCAKTVSQTRSNKNDLVLTDATIQMNCSAIFLQQQSKHANKIWDVLRYSVIAFAARCRYECNFVFCSREYSLLNEYLWESWKLIFIFIFDLPWKILYLKNTMLRYFFFVISNIRDVAYNDQ